MLPKIEISNTDHGILDNDSDCLIVVYQSKAVLNKDFQTYHNFSENITSLEACDLAVHKETVFVNSPIVPGSRLILSPIGSLDFDTDDVRKIADAAKAGAARAIKAGARSPTFYLCEIPEFTLSA
ncbi:putative aminopeptidase, partial [Smittium culicis]